MDDESAERMCVCVGFIHRMIHGTGTFTFKNGCFWG